MSLENEWKYISIDESNHGRTPEFLVAAFSNFESDKKIYQDVRFPKQRKNHKGLTRRLKGRDYNYLILPEEFGWVKDIDLTFGAAVGSLISELEFSEEVRLYVDGWVGSRRRDYIQESVKIATGLRSKDIKIRSGKDLDRKQNLTNLSDEIAHWLYKKYGKTSNNLPNFEDDLRRKPIRKDIIEILVN